MADMYIIGWWLQEAGKIIHYNLYICRVILSLISNYPSLYSAAVDSFKVLNNDLQRIFLFVGK